MRPVHTTDEKSDVKRSYTYWINISLHALTSP